MFFSKLFKKRVDQVFCEISYEEGLQWIHGMVSHIDLRENLIKVFIFKEHMESSFKEKDRVKIKILKDNNQFVFNGIVSDKVISTFEQAIIIKIDETQKFPNLRKLERFNFTCETVVKDKNGKLTKGSLVDINTEGVLISLESEIDEGESVDMEISAFPENSIHFTGRTVRSHSLKGLYSYAFKIENIDATNSNLLKELLMFLSTQKSQLSDEWKNFKKVKYEAAMLFNRLRM
ncbi:MAG: PilZ domain-containing protein [Clostridia bacterium]|nr:PilZ domain-containing protein [Clostridia bacterium]